MNIPEILATHARWLAAGCHGPGRADLTGVDLGDLVIPIIPQIDAAILAAIGMGGYLDMSWWHTCDTTHCRAGWTVTLAGDAGAALEKQIGTNAAAAFIYARSRPGQPVPDWYASDEDALADIRVGAARDATAAQRNSTMEIG